MAISTAAAHCHTGLIADTIHETALRRIDLASNGIYGEGARALAAAIATNVTLKDVDLVSEITLSFAPWCQGCVAEHPALHANGLWLRYRRPSVPSLTLWPDAGPTSPQDHNKMCEAAREMADALTKNHTLHTIHLAQNDFLGRVSICLVGACADESSFLP